MSSCDKICDFYILSEPLGWWDVFKSFQHWESIRTEPHEKELSSGFPHANDPTVSEHTLEIVCSTLVSS